MTDDKKDKYEEIEQRYKSLQQQESETLNFFKSTLRGALEIADAREYSKTWIQYLPFSEFLIQMRSRTELYWKIRDEIEYSNMYSEVMEYPNRVQMVSNFFWVGMAGWSLYRFKSWSIKLISFTGICFFKSIVLDPHFEERHLRKVALQENSPVSQELRNLYRYFSPNDTDIDVMNRKCKEYREVLELRKLIKRKEI